MTRLQSLRHEALLQAYAAGNQIWLAPATMAKRARRDGEDFTAGELLSACIFMADQKFFDRAVNPVTGEQTFRITAAGQIEWENHHAA
jgi:hypothetical protein